VIDEWTATIRSATQEALQAEHEPGQQAADLMSSSGTARTGRRPSKTSTGAPVTCSWSDAGAAAIFPPGTVIADAAIGLLHKRAKRLGYDST
jgi:hypothetical protein